MAKNVSEHVAWLVVYIDAKTNPPAICEAGIFPDQRPVKSDRHTKYAQTVLASITSDTFEHAEQRIKEILCEPDWRWIYKVPVLTAGFEHRWIAGLSPRRCAMCGVAEDNRAQRLALFNDPDRCLVSHRGRCSSCGAEAPILAGDSLCARCRLQSK